MLSYTRIPIDEPLQTDSQAKRHRRMYGHNPGTLLRDMEYVMDLINTCGLKNMSFIIVRNKKILNKYRVSSKNTLYDVIKRLSELGILSQQTFSYKIGEECYRYKVDVPRLIQLYKEIEEHHMKIFIGHYQAEEILPYLVCHKPIKRELQVFRDNDGREEEGRTYSLRKPALMHKKQLYMERLDLDEWVRHIYTNNSTMTIDDIIADEVYSRHRRHFEEIDQVDVGRMKTIWFNDSSITESDLKVLADYYRIRLTTNEVYSDAICNMNYVNSYLPEEYRIRFNLNVAYRRGKQSHRLDASCRQFNDLCGLSKTARGDVLAEEGFDGKFDIHSTIFSLTKFLHSGEFDIDWDLKEQVYNWSSFKLQLEDFKKDEYKVALNRMYFEENVDVAWNNYYYSTHHNPLICKDDFYKKYQLVQSEIGGSADYKNIIFLIESAVELKVLKAMIEQGYEVRNVFDCFYFKNSQITEKEVKALIEKAVFELAEYSSL